ncbi:MAG: lysylphosphatidylglycerol synthase domain-containing protein [Dehalococcoidia bacterium]
MTARTRVRDLLGWMAALGVCGVVLVFAARGALDGAATLDRSHVADHAWAYALATACVMAAVIVYGCVWTLLLAGTTGIAPGHRPKLLLAFLYSWASRYVPGTVPFFASKVYLCRKLGYRARPALVSTSVQNLLDVLVAGTTGALLLAVAGALDGEHRALVLVLSASPAGLVLLHPRILRPVASRALRLFGRAPLADGDLPSGRRLMTAAGLTFVSQSLAGLALFAVLSTLTGVHPSDAALSTGALSVAGVAGMLALFAPAGIGVREGALASLLSLHFPVETAALAAVLFRGVSVLADVMLLAAAFVYDALQRDRLATRIIGRPRDDPAQPREALPLALSEDPRP